MAQAGVMSQLGADEMLPCLAAAAAESNVKGMVAQLRIIEWTMQEQVSMVHPSH